MVQARRRGRAGARLHVRIVGLFSIIAAVPAILVAIVASVTLDRGLDRLFSTRTRAVIENSLIVAEAYLREHAQIVRGDIMAMAIDIARAKPLFDQEPDKLPQFLTARPRCADCRPPSIIDEDLKVIARADVKVNQTFALPPREALRAASAKPSRKSCCCPTPITSPPSSSCDEFRRTLSLRRRGCSIRASCRNCARPRRASANMPRSRRAASACRSPSR